MTKKMRLGSLVGALAAAFTLGAEPLSDDFVPDMKEGLWESSTMMVGATDKAVHSTMCTSNAVSKKMAEDVHKNPNRPCKQIHAERNGSVVTQETECNFAGKVTHNKSTTTLTGNTGIRMEMRKEDGTVQTIIDMKWVGACPAGMKLGDVTGPDGKVMMNAMTP